MLTIDIHTHFIPDKLPDYSKKFGYEGFVRLDKINDSEANMMLFEKKFRTVQCNCWSPEVRIEDSKKSGVDVQVLSPIPIMFSYWADSNDALELSKFLNDSIADICNEYPKKFVGLGTVPMQSVKHAIKELERCKNEINLNGIEIGTNINNKNLNEDEFHDFFAACEELSMSIFIHPWNMMGTSKMKKYWLPWLVGMPAETSRAICSMIFGGIFEKFPKLRVAFAHGGGSFPYTLGRVERGFLQRPDLCSIDNDINPREYINKFYVDSLVHSPEAMKLMIDIMGVNQIALGTDYPFPLGESNPGSTILGIDSITKSDKERLFNGTALEWLNIDKQFFI